MPYNLSTSTNYKLDLVAIRTFIEKNSKIKFHFYKKWLNNWMFVLENAEKETQKQIENLPKVSNQITQVFNQDIFFGSYKLSLNFIVDAAISYVAHNNILLKKEPIINFKNSNIKWSADSGTNYTNGPIIIAYFPMSVHRFLVIDGNHRVFESIKGNKSCIDTVLLKPEELMNSSTLPFSIDKAVYGFMVEAGNMNQLLKTNSDALVFKSSAVNTFFKMWNKKP